MNSLHAISAIALNTFREAVRERIIYAFMLFAFAVTLLAILLGTLSVGQDVRILEDIGLAAIALLGGIIAVFSGTNLVYKELEKRTIYIIFTKPITGWQFIFGKYAGLSLCIFMVITSMGLFLGTLIWLVSSPTLALLFANLTNIAKALLLVYIELLFVIAAATFFSTFASPVMSVIFTLSFWLIAHFAESLKELGQLSQNHTFAAVSNVVYLLLPDLASMTRARNIIMYGQQQPTEIILYVTCYVLAYVTLMLVLASLVTERREFP